MKKLLCLVFLVWGCAAAPGSATMVGSQPFILHGGAYASWAFVYDYTRGVVESAASSILPGDYALLVTVERNSLHVGYLYDATLGRYVEALAYNHQAR